MGKVKALKHNANKGKQQLHEIKDGSVKKNKDSKFKSTPKGKVALINSIELYQKLSPKVSSGNKSSDQKPTPNKNKISKKSQKSSPNGNAVAKRSKQDSPNKNKKQKFKQSMNSNKAQKIGKKTLSSKKLEKLMEKSKSNVIFVTKSEDDSSNKSDESDSDIPDIFGKSLGDESDDEDKDYEEDEEEEEDMDDDDDDSDEEEMDDDDSDEEMSERKGIKMFKGLQSKTKKNKEDQKEDSEVESNENTTESDEDDDEVDTDEDKDEDKEKQKKKENHIKKSKVTIIKSYPEVEDPIVSDSDYSNDTEYSDNPELGTKALLGQSIADDDDDEDFNIEEGSSTENLTSEVEEDDSENDDSENNDSENNDSENDDSENDESENDDSEEANENENNIERFKITQEEKDDLKKRIVLIDNICKSTPSDLVAYLCKESGKFVIFEARPYPEFFFGSEGERIEPSKWIDRDYPNLKSYSANVLYANRQDALKAVENMHGQRFGGNYLNVITADQIVEKPSHAVYIANLKKKMPDNYIWALFNNCGKIVRMRNVRDPWTGLSKGFGYVSFDNADSVKSALQCNNLKLNGRQIKVMPYPYHEDKFPRVKKNLIKEIQRRHRTIFENAKQLLKEEKKERAERRKKKSSGEPANVEPERNVKKHKKQEGDEKKSTAFQGQMVELKNKNKKNKLDKKKKKMAEKLVPKSKKTKQN